MIDWNTVQWVDEALDLQAEHADPLLTHYVRVLKIAEELGAATAELIAWTGTTPRKPQDPAAGERLLEELADTAMTAVYAIQHFTKNTTLTNAHLTWAQHKHLSLYEENTPR